MKPADLQPGHRIPLPPPSYSQYQNAALIVASDPEPWHDDARDRDLIRVDIRVDVDRDGPLLHGELLHRADLARVEGTPFPSWFRICFRPDTDITVETT